jgi:alkanesulfonate monooxygenase SsuD/methylene tetrahydromethanopterin reductase-like flavin-dependent oxidoreductase (luciferase family)
VCFDRSFPPPLVIEVAERLEADGFDQLWVIEDCFYTTGVSLAAAALARTERLEVGLGILPAVARNPAITAMELATLAGLGPGRLVAGIGHGVQEWMEQMGARTPSPLTTLREVIDVVRRLLRGEAVTFEGREVELRDVELDRPPRPVPPVLAGVRGPRSLALAGEVADGVVVGEGAGPTYVRRAVAATGRGERFRVSVFTAFSVADDARRARRAMVPFVETLLREPNVAFDAHPGADEIRDRYHRGGAEALVDMPGDRWREIGAIGTLDDAAAHVEALHDAGAHDVSLFPLADLDTLHRQLDDADRLRRALVTRR